MAVEKLIKVNRFRRKKINFFDIYRTLKENTSNTQYKQHLEAQNILREIMPMMQSKVEKLLTDSVDKLLKSVEQQDTKIEAIKDVLAQVKLYNQRKNQNRRGRGMH